MMNCNVLFFNDFETLDAFGPAEIMALLASINREGTAIMLVTHDAKVAARADRIVFTIDGVIVSELRMQNIDGGDLAARTDKILAQMSTVGI